MIGEQSEAIRTMLSRSVGILAFRKRNGIVEALLVHPGGPFWRNKDLGAWSIPKGEYGSDEDPEQAARREFREELGIELTQALLPLGEIRQRGGKTVMAFAAEADIDVANTTSNSFEIEWPPRSGRKQKFSEVEHAGWFDLASARDKINEAQQVLLDRLQEIVEKD
jgi:predicted NUDIX family NTP pyrophosphohydrolase